MAKPRWKDDDRRPLLPLQDCSKKRIIIGEEELQDFRTRWSYPRTSRVQDNLGLVPEFNMDWESWSEELDRNRRILESDMAAPEFIIDEQTLALEPIVVSP
ncbi:hypothetical protein RRG08_062828 [Elysia crispata]|uniref:Uncharacterized protein n=1 Tax=Elysia crispata TaxID=231223 RepID=A0AAE0ZYR6_9GAST|nr:hypothetical protein RRG08_062828 [Elysia crispata]